MRRGAGPAECRWRQADSEQGGGGQSRRVSRSGAFRVAARPGSAVHSYFTLKNNVNCPPSLCELVPDQSSQLSFQRQWKPSSTMRMGALTSQPGSDQDHGGITIDPNRAEMNVLGSFLCCEAEESRLCQEQSFSLASLTLEPDSSSCFRREPREPLSKPTRSCSLLPPGLEPQHPERQTHRFQQHQHENHNLSTVIIS